MREHHYSNCKRSLESRNKQFEERMKERELFVKGVRGLSLESKGKPRHRVVPLPLRDSLVLAKQEREVFVQVPNSLHLFR